MHLFIVRRKTYFWKLVNEVKTFINDSLEERKAELAKAALELKLASEDIDVTLL